MKIIKKYIKFVSYRIESRSRSTNDIKIQVFYIKKNAFDCTIMKHLKWMEMQMSI